MTKPPKSVTNEDLLAVLQDLMQMTSDGFERLEGRMDRTENELIEIKACLDSHDLQFAELKAITERLVKNHQAYLSDIKDILDRMQKLKDRELITTAELKELQRLLQIVVGWAIKAAKATKVPLKILS